MNPNFAGIMFVISTFRRLGINIATIGNYWFWLVETLHNTKNPNYSLLCIIIYVRSSTNIPHFVWIWRTYEHVQFLFLVDRNLNTNPLLTSSNDFVYSTNGVCEVLYKDSSFNLVRMKNMAVVWNSWLRNYKVCSLF